MQYPAIALAILTYCAGALAADITVGIDLGTSYTVVSYHPDALLGAETEDDLYRDPRFLETPGGSFFFPSMVTFAADPPSHAAVGEASANLATVLPERTVYQVPSLGPLVAVRPGSY
jgi:molecular chaperone DnaK (HSP70)